MFSENTTNKESYPKNTEPIIKPGYGLKRFDPGPLSVMVSSHRDLRLLCNHLEVEINRYDYLFNSRLYLKEIEENKTQVSFAGPIIGAPYAVIIIETLIHLGVQQIIYIGSCGAISPDIKIGDIIIPSGSFIDEGTSRQYQSQENDFAEPTLELTETLKRTAERKNILYHSGHIWTTDAVFQETPEKVRYYQSRNALAVEMELSALFTVGKLRGIEVAGILAVSDELSSLRWKPGFKTDVFKRGRLAAIDMVGEICNSL